MGDQIKSLTQIKKLEPFVGRWNTNGKVVSGSVDGEIFIKGSDSYEWLPGGYFLLHKVDVIIGDKRHESTEIIGFDSNSDSYFMQYFDNKGNTGLMKALEDEGIWRFWAETLRFRGSFNQQGNVLSGIWEQLSEESKWVSWMDINLTKVR